MPKIKTHSGAKKRFRKTSTGKFKHKKAGLMHLLTPMKSKTGRQLRKSKTLNKTETKIIRTYLPYE
jgi:large subunit ribosomal protein L35